MAHSKNIDHVINYSFAEEIIWYAFRHLMDCNVECPETVKIEIVRIWPYLDKFKKNQYHNCIRKNFAKNPIPIEFNENSWNSILSLDLDDKTIPKTEYVVVDTNISEILFLSFKYAFGRATYCVNTVQEVLRNQWTNLSDDAKSEYKRYIREAMNNRGLSTPYLFREWIEIIDDSSIPIYEAYKFPSPISDF